MPCFSLSQAATWPAVRQCPAFSPAWSSACTLASATGLGLPGGASRSNNWATPPDVKSSSHTWMVERARPPSRARSASVCWPLGAQLTTCNRSLSRGSVVARICVLSCVVSVALSVSLVRFLPMPKFACSPHRLPAFIPTIKANWYDPPSLRLPAMRLRGLHRDAQLHRRPVAACQHGPDQSARGPHHAPRGGKPFTPRPHYRMPSGAGGHPLPFFQPALSAQRGRPPAAGHLRLRAGRRGKPPTHRCRTAGERRALPADRADRQRGHLGHRRARPHHLRQPPAGENARLRAGGIIAAARARFY